MASALLLILSGILIGAGVSLIARDLRARRGAPLLARLAQRAGTLERASEIARGGAGSPPRDSTARAASPEPSLGRPASARSGEANGSSEGRAGENRPSLAEQWAALAPTLDRGVARVNARLAPQRLALGPASGTDWSYRQRAYGAYRRLLLGGDSVAWLRLELTADARLLAALKAHNDDRTAINGSAACAVASFDVARAAELLLDCLRPATGALALPADEPWREAPPSAPAERAVGIVGPALKATNGAFALAGARIVPLAPEALEEAHPRPMRLRIEVDGGEIARMQIETLDDAIEVAVDARDAQLVALGRRRRFPLEGMTIHALAELIAGCAWPAIAHYRDARRP
jgi:hypothetical protein